MILSNIILELSFEVMRFIIIFAISVHLLSGNEVCPILTGTVQFRVELQKELHQLRRNSRTGERESSLATFVGFSEEILGQSSIVDHHL